MQSERTRSDDRSRQTDFPLTDHSADAVSGDYRDSVDAHVSSEDNGPLIVSISDIHGFLDAARSALLTLGDHPDYDPIVEQDEAGNLHWASNDYVLVFNGDLVDRGPANVETIQMVARLIEQAPRGRVRVTLGNHEMGILTQALFSWGSWFSGQVGPDARRSLVTAIRNGHVVAAYKGYTVTYAHAGHNDPYDVTTVNRNLADAASQLHGTIGSADDVTIQQQIVQDNPLVLGMGTRHPKGPDAGLIWLDFQHLQRDAPPQVVGHTRHDTITHKGQVICQNVIRNTVDTPGGEAVLVEDSAGLASLRRDATGDVTEQPVTLE
ncbi:metallophosphoesterase [Halomicroarcula sp. F13]|uniref:Metallophosphoesterase n=1 Tax=Haloarcula rubra TaxID=2487747 RepID=A0AAW4PWT5_9EURY|nr:metallophosphoesterase [Halomicroarcula rubra]MBX0325641.1 metallophosphoesterase [Halomicroarcula rubra]